MFPGTLVFNVIASPPSTAGSKEEDARCLRVGGGGAGSGPDQGARRHLGLGAERGYTGASGVWGWTPVWEHVSLWGPAQLQQGNMREVQGGAPGLMKLDWARRD